ncbi:L,D-transpeptidase [Leptolyngbya sp. AN02str]|uniref:L,D-transpeptidase n=1 Tax=Leptolyngbya sp. AN02str TaxID=3423363 RepID=UPI003D30F6F7
MCIGFSLVGMALAEHVYSQPLRGIRVNRPWVDQGAIQIPGRDSEIDAVESSGGSTVPTYEVELNMRRSLPILQTEADEVIESPDSAVEPLGSSVPSSVGNSEESVGAVDDVVDASYPSPLSETPLIPSAPQEPTATPLIEEIRTVPEVETAQGSSSVAIEEAPLDAAIVPAAEVGLNPPMPTVEFPYERPASALPGLEDYVSYLPEAQQSAPTHVVLNLQQRRLFVHEGDGVIASYPVAVGKSQTPTPTGEFEIFEMIENPVWQSPWTGEVHSPGPNSALGLRWIGFASLSNGVVGFHGTPTVSSIGQAASNGCVRLRNEDVVALFSQVRVGMRVVVTP